MQLYVSWPWQLLKKAMRRLVATSRYEVMESVVRAIKPGGRVAYVEYRAEDPRVPIKALHKMSQAQVRKEAAAHALVYERTAATLPWQHVVIFRKA